MHVNFLKFGKNDLKMNSHGRAIYPNTNSAGIFSFTVSLKR